MPDCCYSATLQFGGKSRFYQKNAAGSHSGTPAPASSLSDRA